MCSQEAIQVSLLGSHIWVPLLVENWYCMFSKLSHTHSLVAVLVSWPRYFMLIDKAGCEMPGWTNQSLRVFTGEGWGGGMGGALFTLKILC